MKLDDDGKLYQKWLNKRNNAKAEGIKFYLTYEDYCFLVEEAYLKSSDLGFSGNKFVLARIKDKGPYKLGNCRFITQKENLRERKPLSKISKDRAVEKRRITRKRNKQSCLISINYRRNRKVKFETPSITNLE